MVEAEIVHLVVVVDPPFLRRRPMRCSAGGAFGAFWSEKIRALGNFNNVLFTNFEAGEGKYGKEMDVEPRKQVVLSKTFRRS